MSDGKRKVKLSLVVTTDLNDTLTQLAERTGETKSDVLRKAIALMEVAMDARQQGRKIGIVDKSQTVLTEIIGL